MPQSEITLAIRPVIETFTALQIPYYIGGSVASSAYGIARATMDVDFVAAIEAKHVPDFVAQLEASYYVDAAMILDAISRRSSFNLIHLETMLKVDVFVLKDEPYHATALQRRRKDTLDDDLEADEFYFGAPEDVILSKLDWYRMSAGSERQWRDVLGVLKVQKYSLDITYLRHWAEHLRLTDLLQRALIEADITSEL